ncbi:hypothetical protein GALL_404420 [mine drainage metagenome]|uniref:Uncharacterized protein n=1 Tax=mine drainage metagenome TaxID=410659 RepID=A0A1J5QK24_9ZZZZ
MHVGPQIQAGRFQVDRALAVHHEVGMAGGGAVGNHRDRQIGGVARPMPDFHVQHRGQPAQALRADAQGVDFLVQLDAQLLVLVARAAGEQGAHVDVVHQGLLGQQHGLLGRAADADAQHAWGTPAGAHGRHGLQHPVHQVVGRVEHGELGLGLRAAALGGHRDVEPVAGNQFHVQHAGGVVARVLALEQRVGENGGAQLVVVVEVALAHALVHGVLQGPGQALEAHIHADLQKHIDDAGVLADGPSAFGAHAAVGEDLRNRVLGGGALFARVGLGEVGDVVGRVVVADELQRRGDAFHQVGLAYHGHGHGAVSGRFLGWFWSAPNLRADHPDPPARVCSRYRAPGPTGSRGWCGSSDGRCRRWPAPTTGR